MTDKQLLEQALEALELANYKVADYCNGYTIEEVDDAITAIKQALAAPMQEPSEWQKIECPICGDMAIAKDIPAASVHQCMEHGECFGGKCIYTTPPAAAVQEPVAWRWMPAPYWKQWVYSDDGERVEEAKRFMGDGGVQPLYTTPPAAPVQDSTCNETLRTQGKAYPRTCKKCGLGPCVGKPTSDITPPAYDQGWKDGYKHGAWANTAAPVQEPVAIHQFRSPHSSDWYDGIPDHHDGHGPYEVRTLYIATPAAQRQWVGLTLDEIDLLEELYAPPVHPDFVNDASHCLELIRHVEAKLKEKNT